jgi:hypothetical protein
MSQSIEKNLGIIHYLASQISLGWNHLLVAKYIGEAYRENKIIGAHTILKNAQLACWDSSVLALVKVVDKHKSSQNIYYLLNCLEADPSSYPYVNKSELLVQITNHRDELRKIDAILPSLKEKRDKVIAHLDKKLVNQPETVFSYPPLETESLISAFQVLRGILETYDKQTLSFSLWIGEGQYIRNDLDYLIALIDKDKAINSTQ